MTYLGKSIEKAMFFGAKPEIHERARKLRNNITEAEEHLWQLLRRQQFYGYKFRRQHPIDIFIADFYCHELRLVIEVDGNIHKNAGASEYDSARTGELNRLGISVLRFTNNQVLYETNKVLDTIETFIFNPAKPNTL